MATLAEPEKLELDLILQSVSVRARVLTGATGVAIALAHKGSMICRSSLGANAPSLGCRLDTSSGLSGECVRSGRALRCDDSEADPRVDVASCRRLGIRSLAAAPVFLKGKVVGILEAFSPYPQAFSEIDLTVLSTLAESVFSTARPQLAAPAPALMKAEPKHAISRHNPVGALAESPHVPVDGASAPDQFWSDVFVRAQLPWRRFGESILLHIVMIAALATLKLGAPNAQLVPEAFNSSDVLYVPAEYLRTTRKTKISAVPRHMRSDAAGQPLSVAPEQRSRTEAALAAPDIKIKQQIRVLHLMTWRVVAPPVPASALSRVRMITPAALVGAIPPPPEIKGAARPRLFTAPLAAAVVGPPPSVRNPIGRSDKATYTRLEVVGPPPQLPARDQNSSFGNAGASLRGGTLAAVVAPPPSVNGLESRGIPSAGSITGVAQIVPPPPSVVATGNLNRLSGGNNTGAQVIPPSPSLTSRDSISTGAARLAVSAPESASAALPPPRDIKVPGTRSSESNSPVSGQLSEQASRNPERATKPQEVSVAFIAPVLPLPSSSYFSSSEIFIAEETGRSHETRLIKLVYDYLPYQHRLSEDGPNYPELDKLRVTRDLNCDETLRQITSGLGTPDGAAAGKLTRDEYLRWQQATIPCFRTTADDYRRAHVRARK